MGERTETSIIALKADAKASRWVENGLAILGGLVAVSYVVFVEIVPHFRGQAADQHPMPWGLIVVVVACVIPKTLGRATAGKIWSKLPGMGNGN